ncbi:MAG TPA: sulfatase [Anaerolineales bacterium]|nr:sulfatase [Anaerolineales bacterium]HNQ94338.1 sulfatase [Anaerolineales bacterium]HNS60270.1 sulfatase [Anaerolineales bacterium]
MKDSFKDFAQKTLTLAVTFGLITGLGEGILLFGLRQLELLTWRLQNRAYWYETLWIAPLVDVILFALAGFALTLIGFPLRKKIPVNKISLFLLSFLAVFDWVFIILFGRISLAPILILAAGASVQVFNALSKREQAVERSSQRSLKWLAGVGLAVFVIVQGGGWVNEKMKTSQLRDNADAPNIIVIVVDTLRADHLSSYGYERETSPFMDGLAAEGVRFENAISPSSWTQPSHASMLTGRYTYEHQAETRPLDDTYPTIGEVLQAQGYRTGAFSANTLFFTRRQGFGRGFLHFEDNYQSVSDAFLNSSLYGYLFDYYGLRKALNYEGVPTRRLAPEINRSALQWIDQGDQPFFVFINYFDVHDPYTPPEPYLSKYGQTQGGLINGFIERYHPELTPEQLQSEIDAYDGSINYVDDQISALFAELESRGELENTIVIITADHGESLGEHGLLQHSASLYRQEIHVPLIVWGAGVPSGIIVDTPVSTASLPVTIMQLLGANDGAFPSQPLTKLFGGSVPPGWAQPISEVAQFDGAAEQNPTTYGEMKSVVGDQLQYIVHEEFGEVLYNWRDDPQEQSNLANDPASASALDGFRSYLEGLIGSPIFK